MPKTVVAAAAHRVLALPSGILTRQSVSFSKIWDESLAWRIATVLSVYWLCFLAGGTFVTLAALSGIDGAEFDYEIDTDIELTAPHSLPPNRSSPMSATTGVLKLGMRGSRKGHFVISVLMSLRFWTVGSCFFGLTGLLLSWLYPSWGGALILAIALLMGLFLGGAIASTLLTLHYRQVNSLVQTTDTAGLMGVVEVPFDSQTRGKVRVDVRGSIVDFVARTDEPDRLFAVGDRVLIVGTELNRLWVVSCDAMDDRQTVDDV